MFNTALGERRGTIEISGNREHSPSASILAATPRAAELFPQTVPQRRETVEITTLDCALAPLLQDFGYSYAGNLDQFHAGDGRVVFLDAVFVRRDSSRGGR